MTTRPIPERRRPDWFQRVFLLILPAALILAACQSIAEQTDWGTPDPAASAQTETATAEPAATSTVEPTATPAFLKTPENLDGMQIQFWHPWSGEMSREIDLLVDQFNQTNEWGIHVIVHRSGSSMALVREVEQTAASGETLPRVLVAPSEYLLTWLERDGLILALDSLIHDPAWGLSEQQRADNALVFWLQDQSQDSQAGIPAQRSARVLIYNQTWARELGYKAAPQTVEDFREQACAAAQALRSDNDTRNDGMGGWIIDWDGLTAYSWLKSFEVETVIQGEPPEFVFNQPESLQAFTFLRTLMTDGCAWLARNQTPQEYFSNRQALFYSADLLDLPVQVGAHITADSQDEWTVLPFPGQPRPTFVVSGLSYGIQPSTLDAELASWLFVRWMISAENQVRLLTAGGGLPISVSAASLAAEKMRQVPQWASVNALIPLAQPAPVAAGWRVARWVLEDAAWQIMQSHIPTEQIPQILAELDATVAEVLEREE